MTTWAPAKGPVRSRVDWVRPLDGMRPGQTVEMKIPPDWDTHTFRLRVRSAMNYRYGYRTNATSIVGRIIRVTRLRKQKKP